MAKTDDTKAARDPDVKGDDGEKKPRVEGVTRFDRSIIGQTGLNHGGGGWVNEEYLPELKGQKGRRTYAEMADNCPVSGAVIFALQSLFRSVNITVQASDDSEEAEADAKFVEEVLDDMETPIDGVMAEIATMFVYGFSAHEILWKRRVGPDESDPVNRSKYEDNKIGLRGLPGRSQKTVWKWEIDDATGTIKGMYQQPWTGTEIFIPIEKLMLFRTTPALNNPEGRSILRNAYRPWYFKRRIEEIEAIGVERDLAGLPVARIPSDYMDEDADPADKAVFRSYQQLVRGIRRDTNEGIVLPSDTDNSGKYKFDVALLSTAGSRTLDTTKILDRYDRQIAMSVLADFIFLGQTAVGSFALSSDKTAMFAQALGAFLRLVVGEFNNKLLPALWKLNGKKVKTMPKLNVEDVEQPDLGALGGFLSAMSSAGAPLFPDRDLENHLREKAGLPPAPEEGTEEGDMRSAMNSAPGMGPDGQPLPQQGLPGDDPQQGQQPDATKPGLFDEGKSDAPGGKPAEPGLRERITERFDKPSKDAPLKPGRNQA